MVGIVSILVVFSTDENTTLSANIASKTVDGNRLPGTRSTFNENAPATTCLRNPKVILEDPKLSISSYG
jgi:hypothetical protein